MNISHDRVRKSTAEEINDKIDSGIRERVKHYSQKDKMQIKLRIEELDREWDIERVLELNAGLFAFSGVILSAAINKKWLILPAVVTGFLVQHAVQGWCPPLAVFRRMNFRTRKEIEKEKCLMQGLLGK